MHWLQLEYVAKGLYLGLLLFTAFQQPAATDVELLLICLLGGFGVSLALSAARAFQQGYRPRGQLVAFLLFLVLENPALTYLGILAGAGAAAFVVTKTITAPWFLPATLIGGAALGFAFPIVRMVKNDWLRFALGLVLAMVPVALILACFHFYPDFLSQPKTAGIILLVGLPFFYLLTLAGRAEETEVEIGAICAVMSLGMYLWQPLPGAIHAMALAVPGALYYIYTARWLTRLRIFKHTLRGMSYTGAGRHRQALRTFRRALELDPKNKMAREGLWAVHRSLNLVEAAKDPELVALVDPEMCLQRAGTLLMDAKPTPEQLEEAHHLLAFVKNQKPMQKPTVLYWQCVAHLKTGHVDEAAQELTAVLDPAGYAPNDPGRAAILLDAWRLALVLHPEMQKRVGTPQLALPGRRMDAIAAVERRLAVTPDFPPAWDLKRTLYAALTEAEYDQQAPPPQPAADFDHTYVQQLGLALLADSGRWQRGAEFLRIAARGMPLNAPSIFVQVGQAAGKAGDADACWFYYRMAQHAGRTAGAKNLSEDEKHAYFSTVKLLAETATAKGDTDAAIESWSLYTENERSGMETLRTLADLYAAKGDALNATRLVEQGLLYSSSEKTLLERKDRCYISLTPAELKPKLEAVRKWFDVAYCLKKSRAILDAKNSGLDMVDWALHLAVIAQAVQTDSVAGKVLEARARLRKGERDDALKILEDLREAAPAKFATDDDQEAWYLAHRLLGDLYLNELSRPDLAISCYVEFRKSSKSGADTLYKLGQAHEACGEYAKAAKYFEQVTAYQGHPLMYDAQQALYRVKSNPSSPTT